MNLYKITQLWQHNCPDVMMSHCILRFVFYLYLVIISIVLCSLAAGAQVPSYIPQNISLLYLLTWCLEIRSVPKKVVYTMSKQCSATTDFVNSNSQAAFSCDILLVLLVYQHNKREDISLSVMFSPARAHCLYLYCQSLENSVVLFMQKCIYISLGTDFHTEQAYWYSNSLSGHGLDPKDFHGSTVWFNKLRQNWT